VFVFTKRVIILARIIIAAETIGTVKQNINTLRQRKPSALLREYMN
jgi:hypothetical protein